MDLVCRVGIELELTSEQIRRPAFLLGPYSANLYPTPRTLVT